MTWESCPSLCSHSVVQNQVTLLHPAAREAVKIFCWGDTQISMYLTHRTHFLSSSSKFSVFGAAGSSPTDPDAALYVWWPVNKKKSYLPSFQSHIHPICTYGEGTGWLMKTSIQTREGRKTYNSHRPQQFYNPTAYRLLTLAVLAVVSALVCPPGSPWSVHPREGRFWGRLFLVCFPPWHMPSGHWRVCPFAGACRFHSLFHSVPFGWPRSYFWSQNNQSLSQAALMDFLAIKFPVTDS